MRFAGLALAASVVALVLLAAPVRANAQQRARDMLNRLVQSSDNTEAALKAFAQGRSFMAEEKWAQAVSTFSRFIAEYPSDKNLDAAMYWLAYAFEKQSKNREAEGVLTDLLSRFPKSSWADDAKALRVKVNAALGKTPSVPEEDANDELRILALKALCENDRATCSSRVSEVLRSGTASVRVKEAALILLGRYGGNDAVPALIQLARSESNGKLRMRAIRVLGETNDERALDVLRDIAMSANYEDESPTDSALHALAGHENPRAVTILGEIATRGQNMRARTHSVELLSRRRGDNAVDELLRLYDAVPEVQVKKYVLAGLANRKDPRAITKLAEVARTASDVELRKQAVRSISNRGEEETLNLLLPLYDAERDNELKNTLLQAFGQYQDKRAYQKLMQVVRNTAEPLERRKTAISMLSHSKDPEVLRFLEEMLK